MQYVACVFVLMMAWALTPATVVAASGEEQDSKKKQDREVATSFAEMADQVAIGDTIFVTDRSGHEVKGNLLAYSEDTTQITLSADSGQTVLSQDQVQQVDLQYRDSAWNGALIGSGIGAGGGLLLGLAMQCDTAEMCAGAIGAFGALAGLAGGGIVDAAQKSQRPIYAAPGSTAAFQLRIAPVISRRQKGALVSIDF